MEYIDIVLGAILVFFFLNGLRKGFFREVLGLVGVLGGLIIGILAAPALTEILKKVLPGFPSLFLPILSFLILFISIYLGSRFLASWLSRLSQAMYLGWLNRLLGGAVSALKGALFISVLLFFISLLPFKGLLEGTRQQSLLYQPLQNLAPQVYNFFSGLNIHSQNFEKKIRDLVKKSELKIKEQTLRYLLYGTTDTTEVR